MAKSAKKSQKWKFGRRNPALADDEVLLDRLPIAEEESREGDSGEPPAIALAKKAHPPTFPLREERRKSWWQASALGRTLNSEGRIEGDSKTTKSANKRALHPALSVAKRKVFAVVGSQAAHGFA